jgi:iron(III) transport system substrate-binding protein
MSEQAPLTSTRRAFLQRLVLGGAALAALPVLQACSGASAPAPTAVPAKPAEAAKPADAPKPGAAPVAPAANPAASPAAQAAPGTKPAAGPDPALIEASKKENKLVWYTPTTEEDLVKYLAAFKAKYSWVDVSEYLRLQTGKLYAKIEPEMQQNVQSCDVLTLSEIALVYDFQNKGYYQPYASPYLQNYDKSWKSQTEGLWVTNWINIAGISWNPNNVKSAEAPKTYNDLLDPKWGNGQICFKDSASGLQYAQYAMIAKLYGEAWWDKMAAQKPIGLAGTAQQYEKVLNGEIKINGLGQSSTYAQKKVAGAPIEITYPKEGVPWTGISSGIVKNAPHPATAKLFIDFMISEEGAKNITTISMDPVTMTNGPAPAETPKVSELNIWSPENMEKYLAEQPAWRDKWNKITGV